MQWLAEVSIKRPVFASVLVLSLVVVGVFSYFRPGRGPVPEGGLSDGLGHDASDRRRARGHGDGDHRQDRGRRQHDLRHRRAPLDLDRGRLAGLHPVRAGEGRRRRRPGGAGQGQPVLADLPRDIDPPIIDKVDPDAAPVLYLSLSADRPIREITEFADKTLRREIESLSGVGQVLHRRRPRPAGERLARPGAAARLRPHGRRGRARRRQPEPPVPGGTVGQGARELTLRIKGRVRRGVRVRRAGGRDAERHARQAARRRRASRTAPRRPRPPPTSTASPPCCWPSAGSPAPTPSRSSTASKERLAEIQARLPAGYTLEIVRDDSEYIKAAVAHGAGAPGRRRLPGGARRAAVPRQLALDDHRRHRDPDLDHRARSR